MSVRPGRRLISAALALSAAGLLAFLWGPVLWLAAAGLLLLAGLAWRDMREAAARLEQVTIRRSLPRIVGRDLLFDVRLTVLNGGPTAITGEVRDLLPAECVPRWSRVPIRIESGEERELRLECRIPRRGRHAFGPVWVRIAGPGEWVEVQREVDCPGEVKVLPETFASRDQLEKDLGAQVLLLDKVARARQVGAGTEFVSLDLYRRGDDPRRIDWRATARQGVPIVRRHQVERHRDVLILIDSGRLMGSMTDRGSKLDCAVDAALNLARVVLQGGDRCGIGIFDSDLRGYLAPVAGPQALGSLVECVYDLQTEWRETDFARMFAEIQRRQSKRTFVVILSDLGDAETSREQCQAIARLSRRHLVLFAALRTPLLRRVIEGTPESMLEGARQVVAHGLLRDRGRALHTLQHGGIHVLDVEPRQLTLPLVNQFVTMRQRNEL